MTARRSRFDIRQARRPVTLILVAWFLICAAGYLVFVRPKVVEYVTLEFGSQPQREALQRKLAEVERLENHLGALTTADDSLATLRQDVLSTRDVRMVDVQLELRRLAVQFNIDLESVSFAHELLPDEELDRMVMVVPLEGGYTNLRKFLQAVESSDKFLLVERVALAEGKQGGVMLQLNITLATYFDMTDEEKKRKSKRRRV